MTFVFKFIHEVEFKSVIPMFIISLFVITTGAQSIYSGRTKYSAFVSKLNKLSEEYLSPQKTHKAAVFFI